MDESIKTIDVRFTKDGQRYTYKTRLDLEKGDFVIVLVASRHMEMKIVEVVEVHENPKIGPNDVIQYKWALQKVDWKAYHESLEMDEKFAEQLAEKQRQKHRAEAQEKLKEEFGDLLDLKDTLKLEIVNESEADVEVEVTTEEASPEDGSIDDDKYVASRVTDDPA